MERRRLGRLGHESSVLVYGAAALSEVTQDVADASVQQALDAGINHLDVAASYGDAELRLGPWMPRIRDDVFLASKVEERSREGAWASINASLERLRTDHLDLIQLHSVGEMDVLDAVTADDGALASAVRAVEEGMAGAVGITGHGPTAAVTHLEGLRRHDFDSVLTPLNPVLWRDQAWREAYQALVASVQATDAALLTIKTVARRNWPTDADQRYATWYEPYDDATRIRAAVSWVLAHQEVCAIPTAGDVALLGMIVAAEADRMDVADAEAVLLRDEAYASPFVTMPW